MARSGARLKLNRTEILAFRRGANHLDRRLPQSTKSIRLAAWAGLQDSTPRAALLSLHARVEDATADLWEHPSLIQLWGPRFNDYVVAQADLPVFSLGRMPPKGPRRARAIEIAEKLKACLGDRRLPFGKAGQEMGVPPNNLRYATLTGTVALRWDGARQPVIWILPPPAVDEFEARRELVRRYLRVFGPAGAQSFARWAGTPPRDAAETFESLADELVPVKTPLGDAWIQAADEDLYRAPAVEAAPVRLLPSGDACFLAWGADRELLVPNTRHQAELWTSRVWPGALLIQGEIAGTWRRNQGEVTVCPWRRLTVGQWEAVEAEARALPLPGLKKPVTVVKQT
jgi:hypothetical protein